MADLPRNEILHGDCREWYGCYDSTWNGLIVPEAFAHPAKFAHGLIRRIIEHGLECGYWQEGSTIGDPFGGVALGGIMAGYYGLSWRGVELEARFVSLGNENIDLHRAKWKALGYDVDVRLVQGDSRRFSEIVGQIGRLKAGELDAVISSPPYAESIGNQNGIDYSKAKGPNDGLKPSVARDSIGGPYGQTPGNIGNLKSSSVDAYITSPPYADSVHDGNGIDKSKLTGNPAGPNSQAGAEGYGHTEGQIGSLKSGSVDGVCDGIVTSPPFEDCMAKGVGIEANGRQVTSERKQRVTGFGVSDGQIGAATGETYWQAMRAVYEQMHLAMKPGGYAAIVLKDYVSKGKRVPLVDDTLKLLESLGFEPVERVHAMLVKESVENTLFAGPVVKTKERKSFFRRLAEKKGSPRIDYEEVLIVRRPLFHSSDGIRDTKNGLR